MKKTKKQIFVVGLGCGQKRLLTRQASAILARAELVLAGEREIPYLEGLTGEHCEIRAAEDPREIRAAIMESKAGDIAVCLPGEAGESPLFEELVRSLSDLRPSAVPGVSVMSLLSSRTGVSYRDARFVEIGEKPVNLADLLTGNSKLFLSGTGNVRPLFQDLIRAGMGGAVVYAGEHLGLLGEGVSRGTVSEMAERSFSGDAVFFLVRTERREACRFGIRDSLLKTASVEGLPSAVRAVIASRTGVVPGDTVYVIGDGNGACAAEAALASESGTVYSIYLTAECAGCALDNAAALGIRNLKVIQGTVPAALGHLDEPDAVIVADDRAADTDLLQILMSRNPNVRMVFAMRTFEKVSLVLSFMEARNMNPELIEIRSGGGTGLRSAHYIKSDAPFWILSGLRSSDAAFDG